MYCSVRLHEYGLQSNTSIYEGAKRDYKPGPVQMLPSVTIIPLGAPLLMRSSNLPVDSASSFNAYCLVLLRMGFTLPDTVTSAAVRSYRLLAELL